LNTNNKIHSLVRIFILEILRDFTIELIIFKYKINNFIHKYDSDYRYYSSYEATYIHYLMNLDIKAVPFVSTSCSIG